MVAKIPGAGIGEDANATSLTLKNLATADNSTFTLNLQTAEADIAVDDVLGKINFQAPAEGTGTDANLIAASIQATSEGDFSSSSNATKLEFMTGSSEAATTQMTISSGGIVGIGAGVPGDLGVGLHIKTSDTGASANASGDELVVESNTGNAGISILSANNANGGILFGDDGDNDIGQIYYEHDGNNLRFVANAATQMTINGSGSVDLADSKVLRLGTGNDMTISFDGTNSVIDHTPASGGLYIRGDAIIFTTGASDNQRLRMDSGGPVTVKTYGSNQFALDVEHHDSTPEGIENKFLDAAPDNTTAVFFECGDTGANRLIIYGDGDVQNHDNAYGAISDQRVKQSITDANSQWDDIKNLKVRNFKKKDDVRAYGDDAEVQIGLIAQEAEAVCPKLVKTVKPNPNDVISDSSFGTLYTADDQDVKDGKRKVGSVKEVKEQVKSIAYSVLYMKAIKALQEAMTKIETLETSNTDLKNRVTALEG